MKKVIILSYLLLALFACDKDSDNDQYGIFKVQEDGTTIEMDGTIGSQTLADFNELVADYPMVNQINIVNSDGSADDEINLQVSLAIHQKEINIHLLDNCSIASGAVDLFLAGIERTHGTNTRLGVHGWGGEDAQGNAIEATDFPVGSAEHLPYINYYTSIGQTQEAAEAFYYFTINAAPAASIHWMTEAEIEQYNMFTE